MRGWLDEWMPHKSKPMRKKAMPWSWMHTYLKLTVLLSTRPQHLSPNQLIPVAGTFLWVLGLCGSEVEKPREGVSFQWTPHGTKDGVKVLGEGCVLKSDMTKETSQMAELQRALWPKLRWAMAAPEDKLWNQKPVKLFLSSVTSRDTQCVYPRLVPGF